MPLAGPEQPLSDIVLAIYSLSTLHRRLVYQRLAFFADAVYAVIVMLNAHAGRLTALGTDQHYVRYVHWGLEFNATGVNGAALCLDLLLVLGMDVQALDDYALLIGQDFDHLTALAFLLDLPADDFNGITFTDLDSHISLLNWLKVLPGPVKQSS
jgi:hypothetical protein